MCGARMPLFLLRSVKATSEQQFKQGNQYEGSYVGGNRCHDSRFSKCFFYCNRNHTHR
jgi:hypothetical protein